MELNGQATSSRGITAGVPKGFILDPPLFLINNIDLIDDLSSNVKLFVDGTHTYFHSSLQKHILSMN